MSCDDDIGLGGNSGNIPENKFAGGEWEWVTYKTETYYDYETKEITTITTDEILHHKKISFTENTYTFYEKTNYDHLEGEETYTGTYKLLPDLEANSVNHVIEFTSNNQKINGVIFYTFELSDQYGQKYPEGTVWFHTMFYDVPNKNTDSIICEIYQKIN